VRNNHSEESSKSTSLAEDEIRLIIDTIPGFVWSASPGGDIEFLNQRGLDYTGFSLEQIKGWNWKDTNILHPDDMQSLFETWSAIVASGEPGEIQARMRRFDGEYRWFLFRVAPLHDESGQLIARNDLIFLKGRGWKSPPHEIHATAPLSAETAG
jgi:PAS domain S-box-containing protein